MRRDKVDVGNPSRCAAFVKLPARATSTKQRHVSQPIHYPILAIEFSTDPIALTFLHIDTASLETVHSKLLDAITDTRSHFHMAADSSSSRV